MALLFIVLSAVPCADTINKVTEIEMLAEASSDFHGGDLCSPFCACQCCQVQITEFEQIPLLEVVKTEVEPIYFGYDSLTGKEIIRNLFQPPQV